MAFLVLHGWTGSGPRHWQTWLAGRLAERGEDVSYPRLPRPDEPRLHEWLAALRAELARLQGERVVLCHSLSCLLWLHHGRTATDRVDRVLLVAPPSPRRRLKAVDGFYPLEATPEDVVRAAASTRLVCGTHDPYCPEGADVAYGRPLGMETDVIAGAAHLNTDAGYGPWPAVEDWCLTGRARFA